MSKAAKTDEGHYRALVGINVPPGDRRVRAGATISGLPALVVDQLLQAGAIEPVAAAVAKTEEGSA